MTTVDTKRAAVGVGALLVALAAVRCADVNRGLGEACIRDEDCLSDVCSGQQCVAQPTTFDAALLVDASTTDAGAADAAVDGVGSTDTGTPSDAHTTNGGASDGGASDGGASDGAGPDGPSHEGGTPADAAHDSSLDGTDGSHAKDSGLTDGHPASG